MRLCLFFGRNHTYQCSIIKDNRTCTRMSSCLLPPPNTHTHTYNRTHTCFLLTAISAHNCLKDKKKTGVKLWNPWSSLHFHYFCALQHFPTRCLFISFPLLTSISLVSYLPPTLQREPALLWHCKKICTETSSVKLTNSTLSLTQSLHFLLTF